VSERRQDESLDALASAPGPLVPSDFCTVPSDYSLHVTRLKSTEQTSTHSTYLQTYFSHSSGPVHCQSNIETNGEK